MKRSVQVSIVTNELSPTVREEMWEVYRHYYHYDKAYFMARIARNNYYSFYRHAGRLVGFTGLRINRTSLGGGRQFMVYFGQTVIEDAYRGLSLIPQTGVKICQRFWKDILRSKVYFWADALTYKAYLVFAKSVPEMYPSFREETPAEIKTIRDYLGKTHYAETFDVETGTIQKETVWVNDTTMMIPQRYQQDSDIRFFVSANPQYKEGHGLLTIAPMHRRNISSLIVRQVKKAFGWKATAKQQVPKTPAKAEWI